MRYKLDKRLIPVKAEESVSEEDVLIEILTRDEYWSRHHTRYQDHLLVRNLERAQYCRTDLLKDCVLGTFVIPVKKNPLKRPLAFGFYMDLTRLLFIDDSGEAERMMKEIDKAEIFDKTTPAHLLFEFLEYQVRDEIVYLQKYEEHLTEMEDRIMSGRKESEDVLGIILKTRKELAKVTSYYGQLMNMSQTLTENYNGLLKKDEQALFHLFTGRMARLSEYGKELREYAQQIREMYQVRMDMKQNHALSFLTMVTAVFAPLSLIAGWYGMNFKNMPELNWTYGYPVCILVSILLIIGEIWYFTRKGWLKK
ncbi:CorA family divalent cation transporter [Clostridium boliviensis]|uniref:CorA family divalent cation transporter n=1 Tax=Clostridium boliviensis TaxID=318465 RepID=A0ABU4GFJ7_9CLOT|nr:CorA family divalent cation transporter [Clostridium boliviensis]MDW2796404.1 CorA family divalent cation transporter [Clostridium boliviensis]